MASPPPAPYRFTLIESASGRVKVDAPPGNVPPQYEVRTYNATQAGTKLPDFFVKFFPQGVRIHAFFMKLGDFEARVRGDKSVYEADWKAADLSCDVWGDDGILVGASKSTQLYGVKPRSSRIKNDDKTYTVQKDIWQGIAATQLAASRGGRLWKSHDPLSPPLVLYLVPSPQFLTKDELEKCAEIVKSKSKDLATWLDIIVLSQGDLFKMADIHYVSHNLLGIYTSYMHKDDIKRLVSAQTLNKEVEKDWMRRFPTQKEAESFHQHLVNKHKGDDPSSSRFSGKFNKTTVTTLTGEEAPETRVDASEIMGDSANGWANDLWPGDTAAGSAAEWLHRSAYSFGPINGANWQSDANIVFGTYEANGDMTRAESTIARTIRSIVDTFGDKGTGTLTTNAVNSGTYDVLNAEGLPETITIEPWVSDKDHNYPWLAPKLEYKGSFSAPGLNYAFETIFHTFRCYTPLSPEGQMDRQAWIMYFEKKYGRKRHASDGTSSSPGKKPTTSTSVVVPSRLTSPASRVRPSFALYQGINHNNSGPITSPSALAAPLSSSTPHYVKVPFHQAAWLSAHTQAPVFRMGDTVVRKPRFLQKPTTGRKIPGMELPELPEKKPDTGVTPPEGGFALVGEFDLFGMKEFEATLTSWHGPPPDTVEVGTELPICQKAEISTLPIVSFLPWLAGTPLEKVHLSNLTFLYQNYTFEPMKPIGWSVSADLVIDEQFGSLSQILTQVLQIPPDSLTIQVTASFGLNQSWGSLPSVTNFVLEGLIFVKDPTTNDYRPIKLCDGISLSHIGVRLFTLSTPVPGPVGKTTTSYGFALFGELGLQVPASQKPLEFDFDIREFGGAAQLSATLKGDIWKNALGLGFDLEKIDLSASFDTSSPLNTLSLSLNACLSAYTASAILSGTYSVGGEFTISAELDNFGLDGIVDLYQKFSGEEVAPPQDDEFVIGSANITFSSRNGLSVVVRDIKYGDYIAANASLHLGSNGVQLQAELEDIDIPELDLKLVDVVLKASFLKVASKTASSVELDAVVELDGVKDLPKIRGSVHVYKEPQDTKLQWTVYGEFDGLGKSATLGKLISELDGTFLGNIGLEDLALVVASKDEPALSTMNPQKFPIKRGVQISAVLGEIDQINQILRHSSPGLVLSASWSKTAGFVLDVDFPTDSIIHLGNGIQTDPIELQINIKPLRLMIDAGVKVPVPHSSDPLDFKLALSIEDEQVFASGQMSGLWKDPFGLSPEISIGPNLALEIGIILPEFMATGLPSALGFSGGLQIGRVKGDVAVQISEDPTQELISGDIEHLGIQDLVAFTSDVLNAHLPSPPDFIDFEKVSLYISTGVMIGTVMYPEGFSFAADIKIFGAEFKSSAEITKSALVAKGAIHNLKVGPLSVTGADGNDATFGLEVGASKQSISIDGAINILGSEVALRLNLELLPRPNFSFDFVLHLTPLLTFSVDAQMKGSANLKDLSKLDFYLHALMEQHILQYIVSQVVDTLESARMAADNALQTAEADVEKAKAAWQKGIDNAKKSVDDAYKSWKAHEKEVYDASTKVINDYNQRMKELEGKIDDARQDMNESILQAETKLQAANADRAAQMQKAEAAVTKAQNDWDADIRSKERDLERAKETFHRAFSHAEGDIDNAKAKVDSLQNQINDLNGTIYSYEHAHWYEFWKFAAIPGLYVALGALEASKAIADGVLEACKAVLEGADFLATKGAITIAEEALEAVRVSGDGLLIAAKATLEGVDEVTKAAVDAAAGVLEGARAVGNAAVEFAEKALDEFIDASTAILKAARDAVDALVKCAEWVAYKTAMVALDAAKHATEALEVAVAALEIAKAAEDGILLITEDFFKALANLFDITKIEVSADLAIFIGNFSFDAYVEGVIVGEHFSLSLGLDLQDTSKFIHGIYSHVVDKAPKRPPTPPPQLPPSTPSSPIPDVPDLPTLPDSGSGPPPPPPPPRRTSSPTWPGSQSGHGDLGDLDYPRDSGLPRKPWPHRGRFPPEGRL